jgi:hypothetical protein
LKIDKSGRQRTPSANAERRRNLLAKRWQSDPGAHRDGNVTFRRHEARNVLFSDKIAAACRNPRAKSLAPLAKKVKVVAMPRERSPIRRMHCRTCFGIQIAGVGAPRALRDG